MILVTVGGQLPFDRLIRGVDEWAGGVEAADVFAQIGDGRYLPRHLRWERFLSPAEFREAMKRADAVIGHAGVGTILSALELGKPVLVFPRSVEYREHRSDHQIGTARHFESRGHVLAAFTEAQLPEQIERLRRRQGSGPSLGAASPELIRLIRSHVLGSGGMPPPGLRSRQGSAGDPAAPD